MSNVFGKLLDLVSAEDARANQPEKLGPVITPDQPSRKCILHMNTPSAIVDFVEKMIPDDAYTKFMGQCKALGSFVHNETDLFKAALASLDGAGITLADVLTDIRKRQSLLQKAQVTFEKSQNTKILSTEDCTAIIKSNENQENALQIEIKTLEGQIVEKTRRINNLKDEIAKQKNEITRLEQDIKTSTENFNKALTEVKETWQTLLTVKLGGLQ